jgi:hypothetical protein
MQAREKKHWDGLRISSAADIRSSQNQSLLSGRCSLVIPVLLIAETLESAGQQAVR